MGGWGGEGGGVEKKQGRSQSLGKVPNWGADFSTLINCVLQNLVGAGALLYRNQSDLTNKPFPYNQHQQTNDLHHRRDHLFPVNKPTPHPQQQTLSPGQQSISYLNKSIPPTSQITRQPIKHLPNQQNIPSAPNQ
jgi:hypothetical protein